MDFNLKQLEAFVAVVECGSFTAAAGKLFLAQSTVSGHVAALEKEIGVPLLVRSGKRKIVLTEEGRRVCDHAKAIIQSCGQMTRDIEERTSVELSLAASSVPSGYLLPELLAGFATETPLCRFTLRSGDSAWVHAQVTEGSAQIGFVGSVLNRKEMYYDLLREDRLVLLTPDTERYRALQKSGVTGNALLGEPLIFRENGSGTQQAADKFLCENRIRPEQIHVIARINHTDAILGAVARGLGVAIMSGLAAADAPHTLTFPLDGNSVTRCFYMIHPRDRRLTSIAQAFLQYVLKRCE